MATHSSYFAWETLWTEEPGGLQYMGSQRISEHTYYVKRFLETLKQISFYS